MVGPVGSGQRNLVREEKRRDLVQVLGRSALLAPRDRDPNTDNAGVTDCLRQARALSSMGKNVLRLCRLYGALHRNAGAPL